MGPEKSRIVFLSFPPSLKDDIKQYYRYSGSRDQVETEIFVPDENIPIPVEIEEGKTDYSEEDLSWEMILSAMIKVVSSPEKYGIDQERKNYYRNFVISLKSEIYNELSSAAIVKARNGDCEMALEIIYLLEGLYPGDPALLLNKALILEDMSEDNPDLEKKVLEAYENALSKEQILPEALLNAGLYFLKRREYKRTREYLSDYLSFSDPGPENDRKRKKAHAIIRDIRTRGLDDEDFLKALGFLNNGSAEEAMTAIKPFLEKHPTVWNGWFVLGWALRLLGRWQESLESYKKAAEHGGTNSDVKNETAICYLELGDFTSARKELEAALKDDPQNIKIISNLGITALKTGSRELAAGFFRTVLELDPEDAIANNFFKN